MIDAGEHLVDLPDALGGIDESNGRRSSKGDSVKKDRPGGP